MNEPLIRGNRLMNIPLGLKALVSDWQLARFLERRAQRRDDGWLIRRESDGSTWTAGSAQNLGYAMRAMFSRNPRDDFHFYRVRRWHGLLIASRKVFWRPDSVTQFRLICRATMFQLEPWPVIVECRKIDAVLQQPDSVQHFLRTLDPAA
jgi:hypothetical protein